MYVDSHCHLNFSALKSQLPSLLSDMEAAGVDRALCICTTLEEFDEVNAIAQSHSHIWCSAGVHPDNEGVAEPTVDDLVRLAREPRVVAIGETGLDYFRLGDRSVADMQWQRDRFSVHIEASRVTNLPLVIHTRSASQDTLSLLREHRAHSGVFHCFTETMDVARAALDMGFYISFSGILTFKNAVDLQDVARLVPLDRCLIETDSPYLAPVPFRGKVNSPALVPWVAKQLAELKGVPVDDIARATSANFETLFWATRSSISEDATSTQACN